MLLYSLWDNNVESFSHLFFHCSIVIWLWEWLKEVFQNLQVFFFGFGCSVYEVSL